MNCFSKLKGLSLDIPVHSWLTTILNGPYVKCG